MTLEKDVERGQPIGCEADTPAMQLQPVVCGTIHSAWSLGQLQIQTAPGGERRQAAVATNLPTYAKTVGVRAFMIGLLIGVYDFAELFAKPVAGSWRGA